MHLHLNKMLHHLLFWISLFFVLVVGMPTLAQGDSFTFEGVVTEVTDDTVIVGGVVVDVSNAVLPIGGINPDMTVRVVGVADGQLVRANVIVIIIAPPIAATPTPIDVPDDPPVEITEEPPQPTSPIVIIGDAPIIVIEGPVQAINITSIVIFDIEIQVDPADEILTQIRIGDTIRVEGQSSIENNIIIIVAINITIIETTVIIINNPGTVFVPVGLPANCKRTKKGKVTCKNSRRT